MSDVRGGSSRVNLPEPPCREPELGSPCTCIDALGDVGGGRVSLGQRHGHGARLTARIHDIDGRGPWPAAIQDTGLDDPRGRDQTVIDGNDIVAVVRVQPCGTRGIDGELGPGPPANPLIGAGKRLDLNVDVEAGQTSELLHHDGSLELPLVGELAVLPVTSGCDWQHGELTYQRELKAAVVVEQFTRLAGLDVDVEVEPLPGADEGIRWRTRTEFAIDAAGAAGLHPHHSHDVIPIDDCLISTTRIIQTGVLDRRWPRATSVDVVDASGEPRAVAVPLPQGDSTAPYVTERVDTGTWAAEFRLSARGFWQVHPGAAATYVAHVLRELAPAPGERAMDLYAGVGLFALALADAVGPEGAVLAVESDARAIRDAKSNLRHRAEIELRRGKVDRVLKPLVREGIHADLVVLDPPRTGAGKSVIKDVAALGPRAIAYVACDPAALARDVAYARDAGYGIRTLRAFDAFPMTHHIECIAVLEPLA